jgi:WD40 repeat protein
MSVAFSPDGKILASASRDKTLKFWDVATGKERAILQGHTQAVMSVAFSPDGRMLASAGGTFGEPGELKVWDIATDK